MLKLFLPVIFGSSPRVRRTLCHVCNNRVVNRFISARAENTDIEVSALPFRAVHLRACGEHTAAESGYTEFYGSSPRVRRTRNWKGQA